MTEMAIASMLNNNIMNSARRIFSNSRIKIVFTLLIFVLLLYLRRGDQILYPNVWDEDGVGVTPGGGYGNILSFVINGWSSVFIPVNGYLIVVPKLITGFSIELFGGLYYPLVSTILTWLFIIFVSLFVAFAHTDLKHKLLCAIFIYLIPTDPEVFGIPLYTFWWSSILLFLIPVWVETKKNIATRLTILIIAGLSAPVVAAIIPSLLYRYLKYKHRFDIVLFLVALFVFFVQFYFIINTTIGPGFSVIYNNLPYIFPVFFGKLLLSNWFQNQYIEFIVGYSVFCLIVYVFYKRNCYVSVSLAITLLSLIFLQSFRLDLRALDPHYAGPRYFFLPYVLLIWLLLQCFTNAPRVVKGIGIFLALIIVFNYFPVMGRHHFDLKWKSHIVSCTKFDNYTIPIQFNGSPQGWELPLDSSICSKLINHSFFPIDHRLLSNYETYPFTLRNAKDHITCLPNGARSISINGNVSTSINEKMVNCSIFSTFVTSDNNTGSIKISMRKNSKILYRSGPGVAPPKVYVNSSNGKFLRDLPISTDWKYLEFSNKDLPENFELIFLDDGTGWGQWLSIAFYE